MGNAGEMKIEAFLASPPERDELVVQLFVEGGGQWGEVYRDTGNYWIDLYLSGSATTRVQFNHFVEMITRSKRELEGRLSGQ